MRQRAGVSAGGFGVDAKLRIHFRQKLRGIPLVGMLLAGTEGVDHFARHIFRNPEHIIALIFAFQRGAANTINGFALLVHYIVVFQQMFASVEVLGFHGFLRVFDAPRNQAGFNGHAFGHSQAEHQRFDAFAAEDAHQVIFQGKEKT